MPYQAPRPCVIPGCPNLVVGKGAYCHAHRRRIEQERGSAAKRGYDHRWRLLREEFLQYNPICVDPFGDHARAGEMVPAEQVDHILPKSAGGSDSWSNLQALCSSCHSRKTREQEGRGVKSLQICDSRPCANQKIVTAKMGVAK